MGFIQKFMPKLTVLRQPNFIGFPWYAIKNITFSFQIDKEKREREGGGGN